MRRAHAGVYDFRRADANASAAIWPMLWRAMRATSERVVAEIASRCYLLSAVLR